MFRELLQKRIFSDDNDLFEFAGNFTANVSLKLKVGYRYSTWLY